MSALDRIDPVPLMFTLGNGVLASPPGHAKVSVTMGFHARRPLASDGADAYLMGSPTHCPVSTLPPCRHPGAPSHELQ